MLIGESAVCGPASTTNVTAVLQTDGLLQAISVAQVSISMTTVASLMDMTQDGPVVVRISQDSVDKPLWEVFLDQDWKLAGLWDTIRRFELEQVTLVRHFEEVTNPEWPALVINGREYEGGVEGVRWALCDSFSTVSRDCWQDVCPSVLPLLSAVCA